MKASNFTDTFNGNVIAPSLWASTYGTVSATGGALVATVASGASNYQGAVSQTVIDLTGSFFFVQCVNAGDQALVSLEVYPVQLKLDSNNKIVWLINQNFIAAKKTVSGSTTQVGSNLAYNSTNHKYFGIKEDGGVVSWLYSADAIGWTVFQTELVSNLFAVTTLFDETTAGTFSAEASGTTVTFDNVNITKKARSDTFFKKIRPRPFAPGRAR